MSTEPKPMDPERLVVGDEARRGVVRVTRHVLREMHQRTVAELRARAERAEAERADDGEHFSRALMLSIVETHKAQRNVCERAVHGRPGHESAGDFDTVEDAAREFGFACYPEPQPEDAPSEQPDPIDTPGVHHGDTSEPGGER